jgi:two-component system, cell cycle sensor histidine kinase and response regulator CckA
LSLSRADAPGDNFIHSGLEGKGVCEIIASVTRLSEFMMNREKKTTEQLLQESELMGQRIVELESLLNEADDSQFKPADQIRQDEASLRRSIIELGKIIRKRNEALEEVNHNLREELAVRLETEERLRESEARFRELAELMPQPVFEMDLEGNLMYGNSKAFSMLGYLPTDMEMGQNTPEMIKPDGLDQTMANIKNMVEGGNRTGNKYILTGKNGEKFPAVIYSSPINRNGATVGFRGIITDITDQERSVEEKRDIEKQLRQAQKLEAVGTLAGGIAHDFNNILTAIVASASLIQRNVEETSPLRRQLDRIFAATERATALTKSILAYSRKQPGEHAPVKLNQIIENLHILMTRLIPENIALETILTKEDLTIMADGGQIEQLLLNLVANAVDAMPAGGDMIISSEFAVVGESENTVGYVKPGNYAILTVSDSGTGMDATTRERAFEPFFTTKEVGKGTGLGLAMVYGIVNQHDGFIKISSEPDHGTTFKIYLPLLDSNANARAFLESKPQNGGKETILLIEDDMDVRNLLKEMLGSFGYNVIEAIDGKDGVEKFLGHQNDIRLLLTDVMMPRQNGKEAYNEIKKIRNDIKVIFISGYSAAATRELLDEGLNYLAKPVSPRELLSKIRKVLDE